MNTALKYAILITGSILISQLLGFTEYKESYIACFMSGVGWALIAHFIVFPLLTDSDPEPESDQTDKQSPKDET